MPAPVPQPTIPLHRVRFFDHTPSPITALAFTPLPLPPARDPTAQAPKGKARSESEQNELGALVVARENGEVEIWEYVHPESGSSGNWVLLKTLPPTLTHPTISLMALAIRDPENFHTKPYSVPRVSDLRLFTAGSESTELTERCLASGRVLQTYPIPSPPLWSMSVSPTQSLLCLTTNSANLHFVSIPPPLLPGSVTQLEPPPAHLLRSDALPSRTRTVSVAWGIPKLVQEDDEWVWRDTYLVTGNSDSSFRRWELPLPATAGTPQGRVTLKSRAVVEKVGKGSKKGAHKGTIVWGVGVLPDSSIVTSDSLGNVTFWDSNTMAQRQSFRSHKADGMSLIIGPGGRTVFTSGPDQRVCQFTAVTKGNGKTEWALTATKRIHTHDVRALAIFPPYLPLPANHPFTPRPLNPGLAPILASGGWDMAPVFTPAAAPDLLAEKLRSPLGKDKKGQHKVVFEEAFSRRLPMFGGERGTTRISVSRGARLVVGRKDRSVGIWTVLEDEQGWKKLVEMDLQLRTNLISSAVSQDGRWLAVSDLYETKVFRLTQSPTGRLRPVRVRGFVTTLIESPALSDVGIPQRGCGASSLLFTPDSGRLVVAFAASAHVAVLQLPDEDSGVISVARSFAPQHTIVGGRSVRGKASRRRKRRAAKAAADADGDVSMTNGHAESDDEEEDDEPVARSGGNEPAPWVTAMSASDDGQWLATSDLGGKVTVFNLDTLQLHALLPTLPDAAVSIAFTPTHPFLAIMHPSNTLQFYHLDTRRFVAPSQQLAVLNNTLHGLHAGVEGASFEPTRSNPRAAKVVIWAHDWVATARLDLDLVARAVGKRSGSPSVSIDGSPAPMPSKNALRRKRAREAREQLEASSASPSLAASSDIGVPASPTSSLARSLVHKSAPSSANDPEFVKVATDKFRSVVAVDWLEEGEMVLVERPYADFVGELPPAFWTGTYGRA
ncbi:U3 small nucleolar RNA-associated protein [Vanrija albida]|uniref:U3 small nucleolar RNA-associated protein n=1 Tax=Vanrija albida TaxID=181172 RepID=A0ABR3QCP3_9TREE